MLRSHRLRRFGEVAGGLLACPEDATNRRASASRQTAPSLRVVFRSEVTMAIAVTNRPVTQSCGSGPGRPSLARLERSEEATAERVRRRAPADGLGRSRLIVTRFYECLWRVLAGFVDGTICLTRRSDVAEHAPRLLQQ